MSEEQNKKLRKINLYKDLSYSEVVAFILQMLLPYWKNIPHE